MNRHTTIVVPNDTLDKHSPQPSARLAVSQSAHERQLPQNRKPAAQVMRYRVTFLGSSFKGGNGGGGNGVEAEAEKGIGISHVVLATSETEAWAKYCDLIKSWPNPRQAKRTIECLGPVTDCRD